MKFMEAKIIAQTGGLSGAQAYRPTGENTWHLRFITEKPMKFTSVLETQKGKIRVFKNINSAISVAEQIGIERVSVILKRS